jgi:hypothetical protein
MTATQQNIGVDADGSLDYEEKYFSGDSAILRVTVEDDEGNPDPIGSPNSILYVCAERRGGSPVFTKTYSSGEITITDPANGILDIEILGSETEPLSGYYYHECEMVDSSDNRTTLFEGEWYIWPDSAQA